MIKIKNNVLIKNIIILLVSGAIAKVIGMIGKIVYTRIAGINVISLYSVITPTFMLIITISQFSFPISISKLSAEEKYDNKDLLKNAYIVGAIINILLIIVILLFSDLIASMLHNKDLGIVIKTIIVILPFTTISSIQRGFLHGKEDMMPNSVSNIIEEIVKILLIATVIPVVIIKSNISALIAVILFNIVTELISISITSKVIKRKYVKDETSKKNNKIIKDIVSISMPTTSIRLISSIGFFLEPIILTNILLKTGYAAKYITLEYGIINSYIIPILSVPTFFSLSVASALLPNITKAYKNKKYNEFNGKLLKLMILSIIVGLMCLIVIFCFPKVILKLVYNVNFGINYIYLLGPFFLILYMQPTLSVAVQAMNKTNKLFIVSSISMVIKYLSLIILGLLRLGINSLIYSIIIGIVTTTFLLLYIVLKEINSHQKRSF